MSEYPCPECGKPMKESGWGPRTWHCPSCDDGDIGKVHEKGALGGNAWNTQPRQKHDQLKSAAKPTLDDYDQKQRG